MKKPVGMPNFLFPYEGSGTMEVFKICNMDINSKGCNYFYQKLLKSCFSLGGLNFLQPEKS